MPGATRNGVQYAVFIFWWRKPLRFPRRFMGGKTGIVVRLDCDVNMFLLRVTISGQDSPWFVADSPNYALGG